VKCDGGHDDDGGRGGRCEDHVLQSGRGRTAADAGAAERTGGAVDGRRPGVDHRPSPAPATRPRRRAPKVIRSVMDNIIDESTVAHAGSWPYVGDVAASTQPTRRPEPPPPPGRRRRLTAITPTIINQRPALQPQLRRRTHCIGTATHRMC